MASIPSETRLQGALLPDTFIPGPAGVDFTEGFDFVVQVAKYLRPGRYGDLVVVAKVVGVDGTTTGVTVEWLAGEVDVLAPGLYMAEAEATAVDGKKFILQKLLYVRATVAPEASEGGDVVLDGGGEP